MGLGERDWLQPELWPAPGRRPSSAGRGEEELGALTLSLMSSSMGLLPHSISTISLACPGTA